MNDKTSPEKLRALNCMLRDADVEDVNGSWGPVNNKIFDQFMRGGNKNTNDSGNASDLINI